MSKKIWIVLAAALAAMVWHVQVSAGVLAAGERCVRVLVPSLYLYSILAAVCTKSGLLAAKGRGGLAAVLLFSQFGGYPVGAQLLHGMRKNGCLTAEEERWMLCVCIGCGPGFLLGTVCSQMPLRAGLWMLLSVSLPNLLAGVLLLRKMSPGSMT
ncbi:MAG: hypothetical protein K2I93_08345, partial [Oscillospiraceae bacterium]|nr:hypothetical protein [Oscillospiraceae bacterium]